MNVFFDDLDTKDGESLIKSKNPLYIIFSLSPPAEIDVMYDSSILSLLLPSSSIEEATSNPASVSYRMEHLLIAELSRTTSQR